MNKQHILVIEDEKMLLDAIKMKLESAGFETTVFTSASSALESLNSNDKKPAAIWLDYYMGDMNGLEFLKEVKKIDKYKKTPVLVVSNSASDDKITALQSLGVERYLLKADYRLEEIIKELYDVINKND